MSQAVEYRPIPGAPGYKVSQAGVVIGPKGWPLAVWRGKGRRLQQVGLPLHGKHTTRTPEQLADMAWRPPHETYLDGLEAEGARMLRDICALEQRLLKICQGKGKEKAA